MNKKILASLFAVGLAAGVYALLLMHMVCSSLTVQMKSTCIR